MGQDLHVARQISTLHAGAAHAAGIDMSLIEHSLELTPEQRSAEHQQVLEFLEEVRRAS